MEQQNTALAEVGSVTALQVFGCDQAETLISRIETEVRSFAPDLSSVKSRKEISSLARKVSRSKTALDGLGKDLVAGWKSDAKKVDDERKVIRDRLDSLRDEVLQPLDEWKAADQARIDAELLAEKLEQDHEQALGEHDLFLRKKEIERKEAEQRQAEEDRQARVAAEQAESDRIAREARIAADAAENATREANEKAANEKAEADRKAAAQEAAIKAAQEAAQEAEQRAKVEHEEALELAEATRVQAVKDSEAKAQREAKAVEDARIAKQASIDADQAAREANIEHCRKINNEALADLVANTFLSDADATALIKLIVKGEIAHISIKY